MLRQLDPLEGYAAPPLIWLIDGPPSHYEIKHGEWCDRVAPLREAFKARLIRRELVATGYAKPLTPASQRREIAPALFELLELDYDASEARCEELHVIRIEVFQPSEDPKPDAGLGAASDPAAAAATDGDGQFSCNDTYTRVNMRGHEFFLAGGMCTVVRLLHEASRNGDPWMETKWLLEQARYSSMSLSAVFRRHKDPSWKELIDQKRGFSRLNIKSQ